MKYWTDLFLIEGLKDKIAEISKYRQVYLEVVNTLLITHNSSVRLVAVDNDRKHGNNYIAFRVTEEVYDQLLTEYGEEVFTGLTEIEIPNWKSSWPGILQDAAYKIAVEEAQKLDLDNLIQTKVSINRNKLETLIEKLEVPHEAGHCSCNKNTA